MVDFVDPFCPHGTTNIGRAFNVHIIRVRNYQMKLMYAETDQRRFAN